MIKTKLLISPNISSIGIPTPIQFLIQQVKTLGLICFADAGICYTNKTPTFQECPKLRFIFIHIHYFPLRSNHLYLLPEVHHWASLICLNSVCGQCPLHTTSREICLKISTPSVFPPPKLMVLRTKSYLLPSPNVFYDFIKVCVSNQIFFFHCSS